MCFSCGLIKLCVFPTLDFFFNTAFKGPQDFTWLYVFQIGKTLYLCKKLYLKIDLKY